MSNVAENQQDHARSGQFLPGNQVAAKTRAIADLIWRAHVQNDGKRARQMAESIWDLAASGERWACEFIRDTLDGKPRQQLEHTGLDGESIKTTLEIRFGGGE